MSTHTEVPIAIPQTPYTPAYPLTAPTLSPLMIECFNLRRTVKMLCAIDMFFSIIYSFYNPYFIISVLLAYMGYYGADKYKSGLTLGYFIYITADWMLKIVLYAYSLSQNQVDPQASAGWWIFIIFSTLINIWISKIVFKFWRSLRNIPVLELATLKSAQPVEYHYVYW